MSGSGHLSLGSIFARIIPQNLSASPSKRRPIMSPSPLLLLLALLFLLAVAGGGSSAGDDDSGADTVPAVPLAKPRSNRTCRLDLSDELFGGVAEACGGDLDRGRCCPVLAAWLFAAHARSALELGGAPADDDSSAALGSDLPMMPDDSQRCVDALQSSLQGRGIHLARPNATCDTVICFCGIRLHQIGSLSCPAAFNMSSSSAPPSHRNATPTAAVLDLEKSCRNASYAGCTRCLTALDKLKANGTVGSGGSAAGRERVGGLLSRDCQLMGLTWLLAANRTAYIPTVSAVLRAVMYSAHPPVEGRRGGGGGGKPQYRCSPDQENMPLAVDSLQFEKVEAAAGAAVPGGGSGGPWQKIAVPLWCSVLFLLLSSCVLEL